MLRANADVIYITIKQFAQARSENYFSFDSRSLCSRHKIFMLTFLLCAFIYFSIAFISFDFKRTNLSAFFVFLNFMLSHSPPRNNSTCYLLRNSFLYVYANFSIFKRFLNPFRFFSPSPRSVGRLNRTILDVTSVLWCWKLWKERNSQSKLKSNFATCHFLQKEKRFLVLGLCWHKT